MKLKTWEGKPSMSSVMTIKTGNAVEETVDSFMHPKKRKKCTKGQEDFLSTSSIEVQPKDQSERNQVLCMDLWEENLPFRFAKNS